MDSEAVSSKVNSRESRTNEGTGTRPHRCYQIGVAASSFVRSAILPAVPKMNQSCPPPPVSTSASELELTVLLLSRYEPLSPPPLLRWPTRVLRSPPLSHSF